jgi:two-component system cell cycle response regulator DivK
VGQKILVVEDNELNLRLFCDLLRVHGYEAEPVRDGREAVDRARAFAPDLIVMDIQMPHISGLELIDQLKADAELMAIPVMAVTAYAAKGDEERIRDAGAEGYVSKPISVMRFIEAVRELLEAAEARAAGAEASMGESELEGEPGDDEARADSGEDRGEEKEKPEAPAAPPAEESDSELPEEAPSDLFPLQSRVSGPGDETEEKPDPGSGPE